MDKANRQPMDWNAPAKLIERSDDGSDMHINFRTVSEGTTRGLIAQVAMLEPAKRARLLIDRGSGGMLNSTEIMELAAREDFPSCSNDDPS